MLQVRKTRFTMGEDACPSLAYQSLYTWIEKEKVALQVVIEEVLSSEGKT